MPRFSRPQKTWQLAVLVLAVAATVLVRMNRQTPAPRGGEHRSSIPGETNKVPPDTGKWQEYDRCTLVADPNNDGDSFTLRCNGGDHTFRLYFVDCPEKRRHQFNGDRIAQQGNYFGGLSEERTIAVGAEARDFALGLLQKGPVVVETRWERVFDSDRCYAFVTASGSDLGEALVRRGLARIHTKGASRPGGPSEREGQSRLRQLEREAKGKRAGAWGK